MGWRRMKKFTRIMRLSRKRKSSGKGGTDGADDSDSDLEVVPRGKLSLGQSFCCTSGQPEDYEGVNKRTPKSSPLLSAGRALLARTTKKDRVAHESIRILKTDNGIVKKANESPFVIQPSPRQRNAEERRMLPPPSPLRNRKKTESPKKQKRDLPAISSDCCVPQHENLDCPCCDRASMMMDAAGLSDLEVSMFTSCDVLADNREKVPEDNVKQEHQLQQQIQHLEEQLLSEKRKQLEQLERFDKLEEELTTYASKERELRKIAEDKLLELLDYQRDNEKRTEPKSIQTDFMDLIQNAENESPLLLGYEGRLRKYQKYIAKLENDNLMLVNELKKFKDLSPVGREEHARHLVELSSQQRHIQYESCLDDVANKLVQTLLVQKRLEEECKILHLRVEQLEQENKTLNNKIEKDEKTLDGNFAKLDDPNASASQAHVSNAQSQKPSNPVTSQIKRSRSNLNNPSTPATESKAENVRTANFTKSPTKQAANSSKIPAFSSAKHARHKKGVNAANFQNPKTTSTPKQEVPPPLPSQNTFEIVPNIPKSKSQDNGVPGAAKRKRIVRNSSPSHKDTRQRLKQNHPPRWEPQRTAPESSVCRFDGDGISPIRSHPQQIWSFNCQVEGDRPVLNTYKKVSDSIDHLLKGDSDKQNSSSIVESLDTVNKTKDEGYSTMSSDLQQDSTADTTISEPDHSEASTFVITETNCPSDDNNSVTECLEESMCSSSDSGFGPLAITSTVARNELLPKLSDIANRLSGTIKSKEQIASVNPTVRLTTDQHTSCDMKLNSSICDTFLTNTLKSQLLTPVNDTRPQGLDASSQTSGKDFSNCDLSIIMDQWNFPKEVLINHRRTWHLGPTESVSSDDRVVFSCRNSFIDDNIFVETAEKSTLTEPEEALWREKALAPFIDESIWSLCSSEGDIQIKHFPFEPLLSEPSLDKLLNNYSPCVVVTDNQASQADTVTSNPRDDFSSDINPSSEQRGLERVASDTVLYLKDAVLELEDSMHRGLKSSKNIPALHQNSTSESDSSPIQDLFSIKPELLKTFELKNNLNWPSPIRSSSYSSLQSSTSCHVISDEMDDVDLIHTSRKGSQDPDLSSASDAEYENMEHKDFVERWLQKEVAPKESPKVEVITLQAVDEAEEFPSLIDQNISHPFDELCRRSRLMSLSPESTEPLVLVPLSEDKLEDHQELHPEAKEFNGDFYTLCSIGSSSLKSLDSAKQAEQAVNKSGVTTLANIAIIKTNEVIVPAYTFKDDDLSLTNISQSKEVILKATTPNFANVSLTDSTRSNGDISKCSTNSKKPTGFVKPTRPMSLDVNQEQFIKKPSTVHQIKSCSRLPRSSETRKPEVAKAHNKVPPNNFSVFQSISGLSKTNSGQSTKSSPTKLAWKKRSDASGKGSEVTKRPHWRKDREAVRQNRLKEGCGTAWIHLQPNAELNDPTVRDNLLDSMKVPTSSSSSSTEDEDAVVMSAQNNSHLQRICKERRHKVKASACNPLFDMRKRTPIVGRRELFFRFGDQEKEAIACFDFLEKETSNTSLPSTSQKRPNCFHPPTEFLLDQTGNLQKKSMSFQPPTGLALEIYPTSSCTPSIKQPTMSQSSQQDCPPSTSLADSYKEKVSSPCTSSSRSPFSSLSRRKLRLPSLWNKPLSHNMSQDFDLLDHISFSDSCAESYSSTPESYDDAT